MRPSFFNRGDGYASADLRKTPPRKVQASPESDSERELRPPASPEERLF